MELTKTWVLGSLANNHVAVHFTKHQQHLNYSMDGVGDYNGQNRWVWRELPQMLSLRDGHNTPIDQLVDNVFLKGLQYANLVGSCITIHSLSLHRHHCQLRTSLPTSSYCTGRARATAIRIDREETSSNTRTNRERGSPRAEKSLSGGTHIKILTNTSVGHSCSSPRRRPNLSQESDQA